MKSLNLGPWPPAWKPPSGQSPSPALPQDYLYDLYAVCNHHGGMHGGHYTGTHSHPALPHPLWGSVLYGHCFMLGLLHCRSHSLVTRDALGSQHCLVPDCSGRWRI